MSSPSLTAARAVFRDQLYKHLETVPAGDFDAFTNKLVTAGSTLEYLKYADALFEIILVGGLLQPGGSYLDDGAPLSPFSIVHAPDASVAAVKPYIQVLNNLIRRYKYLQKPLEESSLQNLLQYVHRWPLGQRERLATAIGLMNAQSLASAAALLALTKDHLVKDDVSLHVLTLVLRAYLGEQSMEHLAATLKKGGVKDLLLFFPAAQRTPAALTAHFRAAGLPQVAEWWARRQGAVAKDALTRKITELCDADTPTDDIVAQVRAAQEDAPIDGAELVHALWSGAMASVDWASARPDQIEALALREVTKFAPVLEPFCHNAKTEVALINVVQVHCYEDTRAMKAFPQILKVLYNKDCVSDKAIVYWFQKGSKAQGRQHFLKATEPLVKFLEQQDSDEEEEE